MAQLDERSYLQVLEAIHRVRDVLDPDDFGPTTLRALAAVVPADALSFNEVDPAAGRLQYLVEPADFPSPAGSAEALAELAGEHPLIRHTAETGDGSARRISDVWTTEQWHESRIYREVYGPMGVEHQLSIALPMPQPIVVGIALSRATVDFSDRDRTVLELLRPHLAQSWRHARDHRRVRSLLRHGSGALDAVDTGVVVLADPLHELTAGALTQLYRYFGRPGRTDPLPPRVARWVASQRTARTDDGELARPLWADLGDQRLVLRYLGPTDGEAGSILLTEHRAEPSPVELRALGLTPREAEVLAAVATGATNAEIGRQLFIAASTVKKYLDHIYAKLGVSSRTGAAAVLHEVQAHHEA